MKNMKLIGIIGAAVVAVIVMVVFAINSVPNEAINKEETVLNANTNIETQEKRREDLIYNLVDAVQSYDKHEYETIKAVADSRDNGNMNTEKLTVMFKATAEAYPELKANENYTTYMKEITTTENLIVQARDAYSSALKDYSRYVRKFPNKQLLGLTGYEVVNFPRLEFNASSDAPRNLFNK